MDDCFHSHPKVLEAGNEAVGLYVRCGAYCAQHLTDGFIPRQIVLIYGSKALAQALVDARLWRSVVDGWEMNDFLTYNKSRSQVLAERADATNRQRRSRARRDSDQEELDPDLEVSENCHPVTHAVRNEMSHLSRPDPLLTNKKSNIPCAQGTFDEFWTIYPRRVQKQDAKKAWTQQVRKKVAPEMMITGAKGYAAYHRSRNTDQDFIKHPGSWLRAGGYEDYQPEPEPELDTREPAEIVRDHWRNADAPAVAKILGTSALLNPQPPSDSTPRDQWDRDASREWIEAHQEAAIQALGGKVAEIEPEVRQMALQSATGMDSMSSPHVDAGGLYGAKEND